MVKFRFHRASLIDSLETEVEISSFAELEELIRKTYFTIPKQDVKVTIYGFDERVNCITYMVTLNEEVVGFTNGPLTKEDEHA